MHGFLTVQGSVSLISMLFQDQLSCKSMEGGEKKIKEKFSVNVLIY